MSKYLFIESRDPFESRDIRFIEETATALRQDGHEVLIFLVQNAVLATRKHGRQNYLCRLVDAGVALMADDFSLGERGIQPDEMHRGIQPSSIVMLVAALIQENTKAIWH